MMTALARMKPWAIGPFELLRHGEMHRLGLDDFDRRMALISFDNAIESAINTYLSLDPIQRGGRQYSRADVEKWRANFHSKLAFLELHAASMKVQMRTDRAEMVYYHRLRNELYHDGSGVVPADSHIRGIRDAAVWTFSFLFECDGESLLSADLVREPSLDKSREQSSVATTFLKHFLDARQALEALARLDGLAAFQDKTLYESLKDVASIEDDPSIAEFADDISRAEKITSELVDGETPSEGSTKLTSLAEKLEGLSLKLDERLREHQKAIVREAFHSTTRAVVGDGRVGVFVQALGSGRTTSLSAYVSACVAETDLPFDRYFVVFDRLSSVEQFVSSYNAWRPAANPEARSARGSDLAKFIRDPSAGPIASTIQQVQSQNAFYNGPCLVVYDGATHPAIDFSQHFPAATFARFSGAPYRATVGEERIFGKPMHMYGFRDAISDGSLHRAIIVARRLAPESERSMCGVDTPFSRQGSSEIAQLADDIVSDGALQAGDRSVVLCADIAAANNMVAQINFRSSSESLSATQRESAVAIGSSVDARAVRAAIESFTRHDPLSMILVCTPAFLAGLDLSSVKNCYVTCKVSMASQARIVSLVSRRASGASETTEGRIVDYMGNSWSDLLEITNYIL